MNNAARSLSTEPKAQQNPDRDIDLFKPQFVSVGKFNIRFIRQVKPNAPTLVLLNGLPQSIRIWELFWEDLSKNFDLLAFDIPGFGLSKAGEVDMSPRQLSESIIQMLDHFGIDKAHLVGPDVGVPITLATAITYPDRLQSINIFDGPGSYPPDMAPILNAVIKYRFVRWLAKGINKKSVMKTNFNTAIKDGYHHYQPTDRAIREYHEITHDEQSHRTALSFFGSYKTDLPWIEANLGSLKVPTLITWGKLDPFVKVSNAKHLSRIIPHNKLVIFDSASHFSSEDAGEDYLNTLTTWCLEGFLHT
jgi:pimeloyl-ACP methyl ester carboxylesterase